MWVVLQVVWAVVPEEVQHTRDEELPRGTLLDEPTKLPQPSLHGAATHTAIWVTVSR